MKGNNSDALLHTSCDYPHDKKYNDHYNTHDYQSFNNSLITNHHNIANNQDNIVDDNTSNRQSFHQLNQTHNSNNNDYDHTNEHLKDYNNPSEHYQYENNLYHNNDYSYNYYNNNYSDAHVHNYRDELKENTHSIQNNRYEEYQLNNNNTHIDFTPNECNSVDKYKQSNNETYEEKTKYNKKKSSFVDHTASHSYYPSHQYDYYANDGYGNIDSKNYNAAHKNNNDNNNNNNINVGSKSYHADQHANNHQDYYNSHHDANNFNSNYHKNTDYSNNNNNELHQNNNSFYQNAEYAKYYSTKNLNNKKVPFLENKITEKDYSYEKNLNNNSQKDHLNYDNKGLKKLNNYTTNEIYDHVNYNRERNMNHSKIFNYVECGDDDINSKKIKHKNKENTFVPKYKNLSAKEMHYNSLSGNDNITVLAANKIKSDLNKINNEQKGVLPDAYPFNSCSYFKNDTKNEHKSHLEKLYPTNYNYINNYNQNNSDISIDQRRHNMHSSKIFDCHYDNKEKTLIKHKSESNIVYSNKENMQNVDVEKEEKRKLNPMYSDLFGRKTPDTNININYEKLIPSTVGVNWTNCKKNANAYSDSNYESFGEPYCNGKESFHRKSFFDKDGYDNKKRLQDAMQKGSKISLQAHLQSTFQNENNYTAKDYRNVEAFYLSLHGLNHSLSDEEIKKIIKNNDAHIVSYESEYDLLNNKRKDHAKLCIRHNKGKEGLSLLINILSQYGIQVTVL